jgi:acetolactate synthase-1/2/3 large subunit
MATCSEVLARTLRDAGIERMFGLPGGEILEFVEAAREVGIELVLTHHETAAAFMADAAGQMERKPAVCVSTLGPGAINMALGVANAWLDRSPVIAITAALASSAAPYATHQKVDLNAFYAPFTKATRTIDGIDTAVKARHALRTSLAPRPGPVHLALPSDVAHAVDRATGVRDDEPLEPPAPPPAPSADIRAVAEAIRRAKRPVVIAGLDLAPYRSAPLVRAFVDRLGVPAFVAPKAKGVIPEDHPLFCGVCAGVAADHVILELFAQADLLVGVGYDPVESNRLWHETMRLVSIGPVSIAADAYRPAIEAVGRVEETLACLTAATFPPFAWTAADLAAFRARMDACLHPPHTGRVGLSPFEVTARLRDACPADTIMTTDVGCVKFIASQAWQALEPMSVLQSNGLSAMGFGLPAAIAAKLLRPRRPVVCTVGDGGLGMCLGEVETCARLRVPIVIAVYNDSTLSLIDVIQANKGYRNYAVRYGRIDFAGAGRALGAWARRVVSLEELDRAMAEALAIDGPALLDIAIDPEEYRSHTKPWP